MAGFGIKCCHRLLKITIPMTCLSKKRHRMNTKRFYGLAMKICLCAAVLALCVWGSHDQSIASEKQDVVETFAHGHINWSSGLLISSGTAAPPVKKQAKEPQALEEALANAHALALKNMRDIVLETRVDSLSIVRDIASSTDIMMAKVESLVKGAKAVRHAYLSDGTVEVTMQMPIYGGFAQLVLPEEIKQIEPIKTVSNKTGTSENMLQESRSDIEAETYTGIVVDARGIQFTPCMAPVIVDEKTREVYGSAFVSREFAVQHGMAGYARDMQSAGQAPRVSGNPLMVKGLRTAEKRASAIVISNADASKIKSVSEHISFLKKCRVMIVVD